MNNTEANMAGKVCLVTGASRGIGKGIAAMLSKAGATVYITGSGDRSYCYTWRLCHDGGIFSGLFSSTHLNNTCHFNTLVHVLLQTFIHRITLLI